MSSFLILEGTGEDGSVLSFELAHPGHRSDDSLGLAARRSPVTTIAEASGAVELAVDRLQPMLQAIKAKLAAAGPSEVTVEFGIAFGGETNVIIAKGTADVHFAVTVNWIL